MVLSLRRCVVLVVFADGDGVVAGEPTTAAAVTVVFDERLYPPHSELPYGRDILPNGFQRDFQSFLGWAINFGGSAADILAKNGTTWSRGSSREVVGERKEKQSFISV